MSRLFETDYIIPCDINDRHIDLLNAQMDAIDDSLDKLGHLNNNETLDIIKEKFRTLCDNNRYIINHKQFLQTKEKFINNRISGYESKSEHKSQFVRLNGRQGFSAGIEPKLLKCQCNDLFSKMLKDYGIIM